MNRIYLLLVASMMAFSASAQVADYQIDTVVYRYKSSLSDTLFSFSEVNIQTQYFPCVDAFATRESTTAGSTFELSTESGVKEYYALKDGLLCMVAYVGQDPFLSIPAKTIQYYTPVPIVTQGDKRKFSNDGFSEFIVDYKKKEWPDEVQQWANKEDISLIRVTGEMEWDHNYVQKDKYRDLYLDTQYGETIEYMRTFRIKKFQVKKEKWETVDITQSPLLMKYFSDNRTEHRSFYHYDSVFELGRLSIYPTPEFYFQTLESIGRYGNCRHKFNSVYVFPNPTFNDIKIRFENATYDSYELTLHSVVGRNLWSTIINLNNSTQEVDVDLPSLDKGIYMYTIRNGDGKIITSRRLVIMEL